MALDDEAPGGGGGVAAPSSKPHQPPPRSSSSAADPASAGDGRFLELKSPMGAQSMRYKWPLKKGKGSMRRSEVSVKAKSASESDRDRRIGENCDRGPGLRCSHARTSTSASSR